MDFSLKWKRKIGFQFATVDVKEISLTVIFFQFVVIFIFFMFGLKRLQNKINLTLYFWYLLVNYFDQIRILLFLLCDPLLEKHVQVSIKHIRMKQSRGENESYTQI